MCIVKKSFSSKGFSMVQVLVALGLTAGLGVVIMKNQDNMVQMKMKNDASQVVDNASRLIQKALEDRAICSYNLSGKGPGSTITDLQEAKIDPSNYDNYLPTSKKVIDKDLGKNIEITLYKIVSDGDNDYLEVSFNMNKDNNEKKNLGGDVKRRFLIHGAKDGFNQYVNCTSETTNLTKTAQKIACESMGGTIVPPGKCEYLSNIIEDDAVYCPGGSYNLEIDANNKVKLNCTPCTATKKFTRWDCEKKVKGSNWVNVCYYRSSCASNPSATYGVEFWEIGGTSASGGDTGSKKNCKKKRHKCWGEP